MIDTSNGDQLCRREGKAPATICSSEPSRARFAAVVGKVRAWMVVLPVDAAMLMLPIIWTLEQWKAIVVMAGLSVLLLKGDRYRARLSLSVLDELPSLLGRMLIAAAMVATVIALRHEQEEVTMFLVNAAVAMGLVVSGRLATTQLIAYARRRQLTAHPTILVGGGPLAAEIGQIITTYADYGLRLVGFVDDGPHPLADTVARDLGKLSDLDGAVEASGADVLLIADGNIPEHHLLDLLRSPACLPCDLLVIPRMHEMHTQTRMPDRIGSLPIMRIRAPSLVGPSRLLKRMFDIVVASTTLVLVAPLMAACAIAVRLEGGPGVIFRQQRVGRGGTVFELLKFRSMRPATGEEAATTWSIASDARVGPVGRFLRRTSFDELPQLWNILKGDMTLVGPRPERPHFVSRFSTEIDRYHHRHRVQAGLTGLAQVSGLRGDTSIVDRIRYDNYYIENWSLWLDLKIIIHTVKEVAFARGR